MTVLELMAELESEDCKYGKCRNCRYFDENTGCKMIERSTEND